MVCVCLRCLGHCEDDTWRTFETSKTSAIYYVQIDEANLLCCFEKTAEKYATWIRGGGRWETSI